jgi:hypothetical protein
MAATEPTRVYMMIDFVHKRRGGIADLSMTHVRAKWITRGTGVVMYASKVCSSMHLDAAKTAASKLALAWLAKQNERPARSQNIIAAEEWTGPRYINTTEGK